MSPDRAAELARALHTSPQFAAILLHRGIQEITQARQHLKPDWDALNDPYTMKDMDCAVTRIRRALMEKERVLIFGDYDVDGITATTLLMRFFSVMGHPVAAAIPDRLREGYGLNLPAAQRIVREKKADVVVTVDCGISDVQGVTCLKDHGIDVIVTDHHVAPPVLPPAAAIINPMQPDCRYPFKKLAGVGVTFKLAWALATEFSPRRRMTEEFRDFLYEAMGLVALGTVCDVVPLVEENRVLVSFGLRSLVQSPNPGLRALLEVAGLAGRSLEPVHLGFNVGPRINAAGRMGSPEDALALLTSTSYQEAIDLATRLDTLNNRRQKLERSVLTQVTRLIEERGLPPSEGVVLAHEGWSPGILGIVASRLVDRHHTPAVLLALQEGGGRGSGRSIQGFDLLDVLKGSSAHLANFGGHASAVGFTVDLDQVEAFVADFRRRLRDKLAGFVPRTGLDVDCPVRLEDISLDLVRELERLRPFGEGNPPPLLLSRNVKIPGYPKWVGRKNRLLRFLVTQDLDASPLSAIIQASDLTPEELKALSPCDIAFHPRRAFKGGQETLELKVKGIANSETQGPEGIEED